MRGLGRKVAWLMVLAHLPRGEWADLFAQMQRRRAARRWVLDYMGAPVTMGAGG